MLHEWIKAHGLSRDAFAKLVGCNGKMVDFWCDGQVIPGLIYAFKIEQVTEGSVSAEMWLGTDIGKFYWRDLERRVQETTR